METGLLELRAFTTAAAREPAGPRGRRPRHDDHGRRRGRRPPHAARGPPALRDAARRRHRHDDVGAHQRAAAVHAAPGAVGHAARAIPSSPRRRSRRCCATAGDAGDRARRARRRRVRGAPHPRRARRSSSCTARRTSIPPSTTIPTRSTSGASPTGSGCRSPTTWPSASEPHVCIGNYLARARAAGSAEGAAAADARAPRRRVRPAGRAAHLAVQHLRRVVAAASLGRRVLIGDPAQPRGNSTSSTMNGIERSRSMKRASS